MGGGAFTRCGSVEECHPSSCRYHELCCTMSPGGDRVMFSVVNSRTAGAQKQYEKRIEQEYIDLSSNYRSV